MIQELHHKGIYIEDQSVQQAMLILGLVQQDLCLKPRTDFQHIEPEVSEKWYKQHCSVINTNIRELKEEIMMLKSKYSNFGLFR